MIGNKAMAATSPKVVELKLVYLLFAFDAAT
jgi:hypothetical protein